MKSFNKLAMAATVSATALMAGEAAAAPLSSYGQAVVTDKTDTCISQAFADSGIEHYYTTDTGNGAGVMRSNGEIRFFGELPDGTGLAAQFHRQHFLGIHTQNGARIDYESQNGTAIIDLDTRIRRCLPEGHSPFN